MKIVCAYLLACLGGNASPSAADLKRILSSVGIEPDEARLELFMTQISGKSIEDVIALGRQKLASTVSSASASAVSVSAPPAAAASASANEEKKAEEKEESDDDLMFDLFN